MEFNSLVFPSPKDTYPIDFPYLYRIPRDFSNESIKQGIPNKNEFLLYISKTPDQASKTQSYFSMETQKMPQLP